MTVKRRLPSQLNHRLAENDPSKDELVQLRALGQTKLKSSSKSSPVAPADNAATTTPQMVPFSYVHLRAPLPDDISPEIFGSGSKPEAYFLMRRSKDGYISSTGMFKASFPWATKAEEEEERRYVKEHFNASSEETAGSLWIHPDDGGQSENPADPSPLCNLALALSSEYHCRVWIEALLDERPVHVASRNKTVTPPPLYRPSSADSESAAALPSATNSLRAAAPASGGSRTASPGRKIAPLRKSRAAKASAIKEQLSVDSDPKSEKAPAPATEADTPASSNGDTNSTVATTVTSTVTTVKTEEVEEEEEEESSTNGAEPSAPEATSETVVKSEIEEEDIKAEVVVETTKETKGDVVVESTHVKVELQPLSDAPLLPESPEEMIAKAKEMVEEAMKDASEPVGVKKRKIEESTPEIPDIDTLDINSPKKSKRARVMDVLKEEKFQQRALIGIGATVALGSHQEADDLARGCAYDMAYLAPIHPASSIRHAIRCKFIHDDRDSLIIAKSNRLEIYDLVPEGLEQVTHFAVYGRITALLSLRPQKSSLDHIFIGTDRFEYFTVSWDPSEGNIRNERKAQDITDRFQRTAHAGHMYLADPEGRLLGLYLYEGIFTAIPIKRQSKGRGKHIKIPEDEIGNLDEPCPIRLDELRVVAMKFLYGTEVPVIAVLFTDSKNVTHLTSYEVVVSKRAVRDSEFRQWKIKANSLDGGVKMLIPVPKPLGGVLTVGEQVITYFSPEKSTPMKKPLLEPTAFSSYGMIDPQRYLLSNETGHLYLLLLVMDGDNLVNMRIENLGKACQARAIVYLDNGYTFLGSHFGDSLLVRISAGNPKIEIVHTLSNLAPISDFIVLGSEIGGEEVHQYSAGQTMILTCSGGFFDGGLRSVRSGVGIQEIGLLGEIAGVQRMWTLRRNSDSYDDVLLFSVAHETRAFAFNPDGDVEEMDAFENFALDTATLAAGNVGSDRLVQVTSSKILLVEKGTGKLLEWSPPAGGKIDLVSLSGTRLAVVLSGRSCLLFDLSGQSIQQVESRSFDDEISCVYIPTSPAEFLVLGFWMPTSLVLLKLSSLETITEERFAVPEGSVPRSVVVANMSADTPPNLFVGMSDGEVLTYNVSKGNTALTDQKRIRLGTQTVTFEVLPRQQADPGTNCVIATGERPTMIYEEEGRVVYSAITLNQASSVVAFNAEAFPDTVVVSADESLFIAKVDDARTTHTRTSPLHQFARRVAYSKEHRGYAVATIRNSIDPATGMESSACFIHVIDENFYDQIDAFELYGNELVDDLLVVKLPNPDGSVTEKFVVGTAIGSESEDNEKGRFLVFDLGEDKVLRLVLEVEMAGPCHCLALVDGYILAGLNKSIDLYRFHYPSKGVTAALEKVTSMRASTVPVAISVYGTRIYVGDLIKGVSVLEYVPGEDGENGKLVEVCRQYGVSWVTSVEALDADTCISSDSDGNLMVLQRETVGPTEEDVRRMRPLSEIRLGEMVNRIRRVNDPSTAGNVVQPRAYIATVEGGLFMLGLIHPNYFNTLIQCQANMAKVLRGVGDTDFNKYRAFNSKGRMPDEPFRFVDGELVEKFLDLDEEAMEMIIDPVDGESVGCTVDEMKNIVEALKRLH
ncbi:hypothetical protein Dda_5865 [Drechslerella dactyloides]|uniref:DNA damage-binding protein 1 n=1 Tax=Drechslerella dactyloides TaxID=74499 RepID=A0AAD6NHY7_DREDA|nr:hypothetical protein Dda_5865 [Drechslerella dactyloides]